jgi:transposase
VVKIRGQQLRTGQKERRKHRPDRKPKFTEPVREQLRHWLVERPDLTLVELQHGVPQFAADSGSAYRG